MVDSEEDELSVEREGDQDLSIASRDFNRIAASRNKSGFVEGVEAGKEEGLKEGFTAGFASGLAAASHWAILRGHADALRIYHQNQAAMLDSSEQFLSGLQLTVQEAQSLEQQCRVLKIAADRKRYREEVGIPYGAKDTKDANDSKSIEGVTAWEPVAMVTEGAREGKNAEVAFSELVAAVEPPAAIQDFKTRLQQL